MDGPETPYREKFENLATRNGEIVAVISSPAFNGRHAAPSETELWESYQDSLAHNEAIPEDMKALSAHHMEVSHEARAAIQDYKIRHDIPLDTPPVSEAPKPRQGNAANEDVYGADILTPNF